MCVRARYIEVDTRAVRRGAGESSLLSAAERVEDPTFPRSPTVTAAMT